jgi:glycosyltransferase involved in cell wall biosynthesis
MRVFSLSLDVQILDAESVVASRVRAYGEAVDLYTVVVPTNKTESIALSEKVHVYGVAGFAKFGVFYNLFLRTHALLKVGKYDVITSQDAYFLGLVGVLLSRMHHSGLEIQAHGIEKDTIVRRTLARFVYSKADVVRTVSERLKKILVERYGVRPEKIVVIPVFVDVSSLRLSAKTAEVEEKIAQFKNQYGTKFNILSVGRLVPVKNILLQLQALLELKKRYPQVHLHVVGEGAERASLEAFVGQNLLQECVTFHGHLSGSDLGALYLSSDMFLHTAESEGYGMVFIEALHAGLPIVTTDVGCVGEIIHHEENALVVQVGDAESVVLALTRLIEEEEVRDGLASASKETVTHLKSFDEVVLLYTKTWKSIV